jgi:hypothetical protein
MKKNEKIHQHVTGGESAGSGLQHIASMAKINVVEFESIYGTNLAPKKMNNHPGTCGPQILEFKDQIF